MWRRKWAVDRAVAVWAHINRLGGGQNMVAVDGMQRFIMYILQVVYPARGERGF